jgi:hypothetical protein
VQHILKLLFSPLAFAVGFLWPLFTQILIAAGLSQPGWFAMSVGAAIAISLGVMAQVRGSWLWIK